MPHHAVEILPRFYFFQRGYLNANHFAQKAEHPILIDTGYLGDWETTETLLTGLGLDLAKTALILNTHTHCDHVGGNHRIQVQSGCAIALHPRGVQNIRAQDDRATWWSFYHQEAEFFKPTRALEDGEVVRVGPHAFEVIHTPGHASDGLVLYNRSERLLLSSDTLWENDFPVMTLAVEGDAAIETMLASLDKIAHLAVDRVYPGHGDPFDDYRGALGRAVSRLERFQIDPAQVGWDLIKKIVVYTIMMKREVPMDGFYDHLMQTNWFRDTIDRYFDGDYRSIFDRVLTDFEHRRIIRAQGRHWVTTVHP